jgi:hypothetical protein
MSYVLDLLFLSLYRSQARERREAHAVRTVLRWTVVFLLLSLVGPAVLGKEIRLPGEGVLSGQVVLAESFFTEERGVLVPREFQAWPGENGLRPADWFTHRIEAHPGDVVLLAQGLYKVDLWVFTPGITIETDPAAKGMAEVWGTIEIDADRVVLDRIAVTGPRKEASSGHGIEVNREVAKWFTIRNSRIERKEWIGIHLIGPRGEMNELRVENCEILNNGADGVECQSVQDLVIIGCTIRGNNVGVRIGSYVQRIEMRANAILGNRSQDVLYPKSE